MIKEEREIKILTKGNKTKIKIEYLLICDRCKKELWINKHDFLRKRRFCSKSCTNLGRQHTEESKDKRRLNSLGEKNNFYGKKHTKEVLEKISEKVKLGFKNLPEEEKERLRNIRKEKTKEKNSFYGKKHSDESKEKMSKTRSENIASGKIYRMHGLNGIYISEKTKEENRYDSFYEYLYMKILDNDLSVIFWTKKHNIKIAYFFDGIERHYIPDFLIEKNNIKIISEVKGYEEKNKLNAKIEAVKNFTKSKNWIFDFVDHETLNEISKRVFGLGILEKRKEFKVGKF